MNTATGARAFAFAAIFVLCASHLGPAPAHALTEDTPVTPAPVKAVETSAANGSTIADDSAASAASSAADSSTTATEKPTPSVTASDSVSVASDSVSASVSDKASATASDPVSATASDSVSATASDSTSEATAAVASDTPTATTVTATDENTPPDKSNNTLTTLTRRSNDADLNNATEASRRSTDAEIKVEIISDNSSDATSAVQESSIVAAIAAEATVSATAQTPGSDLSTSGRRKSDGVSDVTSASAITNSDPPSKDGDETSESKLTTSDASTSAVVSSSPSKVDDASGSRILADMPSTPHTLSLTDGSVLYDNGAPVQQNGLPNDQDWQSRRAFNQMAQTITSTVASSMADHPNPDTLPTRQRYIIQTVPYPYYPFSYSPFAYTFQNLYRQLNSGLPSIYSFPNYYQAGRTNPSIQPTRTMIAADPDRPSPFHMRVGASNYNPTPNNRPSYQSYELNEYDTRRSYHQYPQSPQRQIYYPRTAPNQRTLPEIARSLPNRVYPRMHSGKNVGSDSPSRFHIVYPDRNSRSLSVRPGATHIDDNLVSRIFRQREK